MKSTLPMRIGNLLYKHAFPLYRPLYGVFKRRQDAAEIRLLQELVQPGDTVLDIGSNIGFYSTLLSDRVGPAGRVHCFEPDRDNFRHLTDAMRGRTNAVLNNAAVSAAGGTLTLYTSHRLNVDHRTYAPEVFAGSYTVPAIRIDEYLPETATVQFVKMDIQGAEYNALQGMGAVLKRSPRVALLLELAPRFLEACSHVGARELLELLQSYGLHAAMLTDRGLQPVPDRFEVPEGGGDFYCNLLAGKSDSVASRPSVL